MTETRVDALVRIVRTTKEKILRFRERRIGEQNTKATLIEPVLEALGWDIGDPDEVHREFKSKPQDSPVDYALKLLRTPRLFLEAKGLGEDLADRKWIAQVLGYATVAGVEWCVLSDGDHYRFFNASAPVDAEEKMFREIRLSQDSDEHSAKTLDLISRSHMEDNLLQVLWDAHFADRRVKAVLQEMVGSQDRALLRLIRKKVSGLSPKQVAESLKRLDVRFESPEMPDGGKPKRPDHPPKKPGQRSRQEYGVELAELIADGVLKPPVRLVRKYMGRDFEATLLPDGRVEFRGVTYNTCSAAGDAARKTVTGKQMSTNGWKFWRYQDDNGKVVLLDEARRRLLKARRT